VSPIFLSLEDVLELHEDQINRYGGSAGIRDIGLLLSAIEMPKASFGGQFLHEDLYAMSAAYLFHIVQNHPFIDGNKRAGLAAVIAFMGLNNLKVKADNDTLTDLVLSVAQGNADKGAIAKFLQENSVQRQP
jgi:death-on-curing protein